MNDKIRVFLQKLAEDSELAAKFKACRTVDEAYEVACSVADGFTKEEFIDAMKLLHAAANGGVSDEDLGKYAGGGDSVFSIYSDTGFVTGLPHSFFCAPPPFDIL